MEAPSALQVDTAARDVYGFDTVDQITSAEYQSVADIDASWDYVTIFF